jgi:hypothetical protein
MKFRDRIIDFRRVKASELKPNPENPWQHPEDQRVAMEAALRELGFVDAVMTRQLKDGSLQICDGHLRSELGEDQEVPVLVTDLTEEEARKVLLTFDELKDLADLDPESYAALLKEVEFEDKELKKFVEEVASELDDGLPDLSEEEEEEDEDDDEPPYEHEPDWGDVGDILDDLHHRTDQGSKLWRKFAGHLEDVLGKGKAFPGLLWNMTPKAFVMASRLLEKKK